MLDLQATDLTINKENLPFILDPQSKRSTPQLNQMPSKTKRGMWPNETLEKTMDVIKKGTHSLRRVNKSWNIPMSSLTYHRNGITRFRKMGPKGVLT
jgi:hypothetical protein